MTTTISGTFKDRRGRLITLEVRASADVPSGDDIPLGVMIEAFRSLREAARECLELQHVRHFNSRDTTQEIE